MDKEIIIIDRLEYIKVLNPKPQKEENSQKFLYIPVDEYLAKKDSYVALSFEKGEYPLSPKPPMIDSSPSKWDSPSPVSILPIKNLKKKVLITHFDDRTSSEEEALGDWIAEKLIKEISNHLPQILFIDYPMVKEFLERFGILPAELDHLKGLQILNEAFGIHAVIIGELSGPYIFTAKGLKDQEALASAIIKIEARILETFSGRVLRSFSVQNPIMETKTKGTFADEKAKIKAIGLALSEMGRALSKELERLEWYGRITRVDGEEIYINAGKLSGLKVGDIMEVYPLGVPEERRRAKGKVQISAFLGIDASIGRWIQGQKPEALDIIKVAIAEGS
ncbi:MAG: hypothetical protein ACUVT6_03945 [Thermodesulfobacteriota bacterium]